MKLSLEAIISIIKTVEKVFLVVKKHLHHDLREDQDGLFFCLMDRFTGRILVVIEIGEVNEEKAKKRFEFSQEKAMRLFRSEHHKTSYQSRNESENKYGGAIATSNLIFSCSGLPELMDEAIMLISACHSGFLNDYEALDMAQISRGEADDDYYYGPIKKLIGSSDPFLSENLELQKKLIKLGHSFIHAISEDNTELAKKIRNEAISLTYNI